jgi:amylosucrase
MVTDLHNSKWYTEQSKLTLERLLPHIEPILSVVDVNTSDVFIDRLDNHFVDLFRLLHDLYGKQYDFIFHLEDILAHMARMFVDRPLELKQLDNTREADSLWFQSENMVGAVCYVDLFADTLPTLKEKIPYFTALGITYLHLMPLFKSPDENSDGGYAVSDYRQVNPTLGTMQELAGLASEFRQHGISLVLDFVFNHTSDEHDWVMRAKNGESQYMNYYRLYDERTIPDQYEQNLREIFPEQDPGNFTYIDELQKWAWTTFYHFQWDLNYANPAVFNAMMGEMLFLANQGVEILRLDAVAFIWKKMGTSCENLPEAHKIIQAYNAVTRIVCPALLFKSEAIVHPRDVATYISWEECPISYNPTLMALSWEALATRDVSLLRLSMSRRFELPSNTAWVNYVRVHDDIGWTFANEDADELGINSFDHRLFLNEFYTGEFEGSFARGLSFNYNPINKDRRITGTAASLGGLEKAIETKDELSANHAIQRVLMIYSIVMSVGGLPLIYLGDEIATLNDYAYLDDSDKKEDSRWVHRQYFNWKRAEKRQDDNTHEGKMYQSMVRMIQIRKSTPELGAGQTLFFDTDNKHVFGYIRNKQILVLCNFSEEQQVVTKRILSLYFDVSNSLHELLTNTELTIQEEIFLQPYHYIWLKTP